jgi:hypothetical protein
MINHDLIKQIRRGLMQSSVFLNVDLLPAKIVQLSKSKDFPLHLLCFCFFHNTVAIVLEMEHRSIEPVECEVKN